MDNKHLGSDFNDFLAEQGILEECAASAVKAVLAMELADTMKAEHITKSTLVERMHTSRSQLDRILDPNETGTSIDSLVRAAAAMGRHLDIRLA